MEAKVELKELPPKKRVAYIWEYYKVWILIGLFAIYSIISGIYQYATAKEPLFQMIMLNGSISLDERIFAEDYLTDAGYSIDDYEIKVSTMTMHFNEFSYADDYNTMQSFVARITSGDIDLISAPKDLFDPYGKEGYLMDLTKVFSEDELLKYKPYLVYTTDDLTNTTYPCAFDFSQNEWVKKHAYYTDSCHYGIIYDCSNIEQVKQFLTYILNY